jgi:DNA adenine methylase
MVKPERPIVRYHGGKWRLAPWIISFFPKTHRVYVEPFGGGGSVLLRKERAYAEIYNDLDGEMVNLFRVVRDRGAELVRVLELTPFARQEFDLSYEPSTDPVEIARRTLVRASMGFGSTAVLGGSSGFRVNSNRSHTAPAHDWRNFPGHIPAIIERLRGVVIEHKDALSVMQQHDAVDTLHYCDPPYVHSTRGLRNVHCIKHRYRHEMSDDDHAAFAQAAHDLKGMVVISGYASDLYDRELFADWERFERETHADGARDRTEVVWLNKACAEQLHGSGLFASAGRGFSPVTCHQSPVTAAEATP